MTKKRTGKIRLELDTELIADLDAVGGEVMGGQSGSGGGSVIFTVGCPTRGVVKGGDSLNVGC